MIGPLDLAVRFPTWSNGVVSLAGALVLAGCTTTPSKRLPARIVVVPSSQMKIGAVKAFERDSSVLVRGRFARRPFPRRGYLDVEAWGAQGFLMRKHARWSRSGRLVFRSNFSATLPVPATQVQEIRISYHRRRKEEPAQ